MSKYTKARLARLRKLRSNKKMTANKVKKIAQSVINKQVEFKRRLDYQSGIQLTSTANGHVLFDGPQIAVGDGAENRDGLQVQLKKLRFKLQIAYKGVPTKVRLIGIRYPQGSEAPTLADLLTHPTATQCFYSPWLKSGPVKYAMFCNKTVSLGGDAVMTSSYKERYVNISVKLPKAGIRISYEDGATQTPDKNRYTLFAIPNHIPAIADDRVLVSNFVETGFTDM